MSIDIHIGRYEVWVKPRELIVLRCCAACCILTINLWPAHDKGPRIAFPCDVSHVLE